MMNKKIAFMPHKTRGQEIIKILEGMGGVNMYNIDGSEGIIAIETKLRGNPITNDWDYCGLLELGWKIYTLEEWETMKSLNENFEDYEDIIERFPLAFVDDHEVVKEKIDKLIERLGSDYINILGEDMGIWEELL